jgi:hypothetical protein
MIFNIVDKRSRRFRWKNVNAIAEATSHDNFVADSDQIKARDDDLTYAERNNISVAEAVAWAQSFPGPITLFLYDAGKRTT